MPPLPPKPTLEIPQLEVVDPRWLLKALALTLTAGAILAYLTLCLLIYQGSWQLFLHPSTRIDRTPSVPFQTVPFDAAATGRPRLTAWWIPCASRTSSALCPPGTPTILFLHDGQGSLSSSAALLDRLHAASVNIFAIDYRGFGQSEAIHPSEARMSEDTTAALEYLVSTRHLPASNIVPYGTGLGAALAATLLRSHSELAAVILDNPDPDAYARTLTDSRSRLLPTRLLLRDRFDLQLEHLTQPKLLIVGGLGDTTPSRDRQLLQTFKAAPDPRFILELAPPAASDPSPTADDPCPSCPGPAYIASVRRFLDQAMPQPIPILSPH